MDLPLNARMSADAGSDMETGISVIIGLADAEKSAIRLTDMDVAETGETEDTGGLSATPESDPGDESVNGGKASETPESDPSITCAPGVTGRERTYGQAEDKAAFCAAAH